MSKKDKYFLIFAYIFTAVLLWFMADVLGGWTILAQVMGAMAVMFVIMGAIMAAIIGTIYYLTVFRSSRYAKRLREAGYAVHLHKHQVWGFAVMALIALFFVPMAAWMTERVYSIHLCIQAGDCYKAADWYYTAPVMVGMIWLLGLLGLGSVVTMWWQSFRPLRKYYNEMQLGHELDLPRLR